MCDGFLPHSKFYGEERISYAVSHSQQSSMNIKYYMPTHHLDVKIWFSQHSSFAIVATNIMINERKMQVKYINMYDRF